MRLLKHRWSSNRQILHYQRYLQHFLLAVQQATLKNKRKHLQRFGLQNLPFLH